MTDNNKHEQADSKPRRKTAKAWVESHGYGIFWRSMSRAWRKRLSVALSAPSVEDALSAIQRYERLLERAREDLENAKTSKQVIRDTLTELDALQRLIRGDPPRNTSDASDASECSERLLR